MDAKERITELIRMYGHMQKQWMRWYAVCKDGTRIEWIQ